VYIGTENGVIAGVGRGVDTTQIPADFDPRLRPWYQAAIGVDRLIWTAPYVSARSGHSLVVTAARRVTNAAGRPVAVVALDLDDAMAQRLGSAVLHKNGYAFVLDNQGNMIVSPGLTAGETAWDHRFVTENLFQSGSASVREIAAQMVSGQSGTGSVQFDEGERFVAYAPLKTTGWSIALVVAPEEVTSLATQLDELISDLTQTSRAVLASQSSRVQGEFAMLVALIVLLAGLATVALARTITRRLERLGLAARELEAGTLSDEEIRLLRESQGRDEIASLMRLFGRTALGVKSREAELRQQVQDLHIEIDRTRAAEEVAQITDSEYFKELQSRARELRAPRDPTGH
jgi:HAMP domain-containing protein